jgi:hypothetical protein
VATACLRRLAYASAMAPESNEPFEVKCPKCKRRVKVEPKEAERAMKVRCPCGEEIQLAKMI